MTKRTYENDRIRVFWDSGKCIHSRNCVKGLPQVFNRAKKPWIDVNAADVADLRRVIDSCPSGALRYELVGAPEPDTCIRVLKNGPYRVTGSVRLLNAEGSLIETDACFTLCRCGKSRKKPFCDGTHTRIQFREDD